MAEYISATITNKYYDLTAAGRKVADYVLTDSVSAQYMSISDLAEACGVGEASITRFCRTLGLRGYSDFKLALAEEAGNRQDITARAGIEPGDSVTGHIRRLLSVQTALLAQTVERLEPEALTRAVELLSGARRVLCLGQGSSQVMAQEAWTLFSTVSGQFSCVMDSHSQAVAVALMDAEDAILCFSYSGSTKELEDVLPLAVANGTRVVLVTRYAKSPAVNHSDVVLHCGSDEGPLQQSSAAARISQLFIIDALFQEYCLREPEQSARNRDKVARAMALKHV